MRSRSDTWIDIVADGEYNMEAVALIYGATGSDENAVVGNGYRQYATITAPKIKRELFADKALSIGNCLSGTLSFSIMTTDEIPRSAKIVIMARPTDGTNYGEWMSFGTFWLDKRSTRGDLTDIEAYDAMKKGNQAYSDNSAGLNWPKTIAMVVTRIAEQIGVSIDSRTTSAVINSALGAMDIVTMPNDEDTLLDILGNIGGILGGNWTITEDNALRYIPLVAPPPDTSYILDHKYNRIKTDQGDYLIWHGTSSQHNEPTHPAGGGLLRVPVVLGTMTTATPYAISKVTLSADVDHTYTRGDSSGHELIVEDNPYATDALCQTLFLQVNGLEYKPYELTNAIYDPATELGDWVTAGAEVRSVVYAQKIALDTGFRADVSAPGEDELESEYPYQSADKRMKYEMSDTQAGVRQTRTMIEQTNEQVSIIADDYTPRDEVKSAFALDPTNITLSAGVDQQGNPTGTITFNAGALIVNGNNFSLSRTGIMRCNGAEINGKLTTSYTDENHHEYKTILDMGELTFYYDNTAMCSVGFSDGRGTGVYTLDGNDVTLNASVTDALNEIIGGAWVTAHTNGNIDLRGDSIIVGAWDALPQAGYTGTIQVVEDVDSQTGAPAYGEIEVYNGLIVDYRSLSI